VPGDLSQKVEPDTSAVRPDRQYRARRAELSIRLICSIESTRVARTPAGSRVDDPGIVLLARR
jgi:hypothetical protein